MKQLWSDNLESEVIEDWQPGSTRYNLYEDIQKVKTNAHEEIALTRQIAKEYTKKAETLVSLVERNCKGCTHAPFDRRFTHCLTCITTKHYKRKPIIRWMPLESEMSRIYNTHEEAYNAYPGKIVKLVEEKND